MKLYQAIALAIKNDKDLETMEDMLPSGSGFDSGCHISDDSTPDKIIIDTSYHCMTENGYYDGWIDFQVIITPSLTFGYYMDFKGYSRDKRLYRKYWTINGDFFYDTFDYSLNQEVTV